MADKKICQGQIDGLMFCTEAANLSKLYRLNCRLNVGCSNTMLHLRTKGLYATLKLALSKVLRFMKLPLIQKQALLYNVPQSCDKEVLNLKPGELVVVHIDWAITQDGTGPLAVQQVERLGFKNVFNPERVILFIDHAAPSPRKELSDAHILLRSFASLLGSVQAMLCLWGQVTCTNVYYGSYGGSGSSLHTPVCCPYSLRSGCTTHGNTYNKIIHTCHGGFLIHLYPQAYYLAPISFHRPIAISESLRSLRSLASVLVQDEGLLRVCAQ